MKLCNKNTGEIGIINLKVICEDLTYCYESLESFLAEWEVTKPKEPLIKDEKIRKAVRAWAEANDIDRVWHECVTSCLRGNGLVIYFEGLELEQGNYTIAELCGEEKE